MGESNKHKVLVEYALRFIKDSVGEELESLRQDVSLLAMDILSRQKNYLQLVATRSSIDNGRIQTRRIF